MGIRYFGRPIQWWALAKPEYPNDSLDMGE
jgi:hypothetical protein